MKSKGLQPRLLYPVRLFVKWRAIQGIFQRKEVIYWGAPIRLSANFSKDTLTARRDWQEIFKVMKSRDLQPRLLYSVRLLFRIEGQIKSFPDKKNLKEFIITKLLLNEVLKGLI